MPPATPAPRLITPKMLSLMKQYGLFQYLYYSYHKMAPIQLPTPYNIRNSGHKPPILVPRTLSFRIQIPNKFRPDPTFWTKALSLPTRIQASENKLKSDHLLNIVLAMHLWMNQCTVHT